MRTVFIAAPGTETLPVRMFLYIQDNIDPLVTSVSACVIALTVVVLVALDRAYGLERLLVGRGSNGRRAFERVRRDFEAVTREELLHVTAVWVDAAMHLNERDLRMMDRLVRAQERGGVMPFVAPQAPARLNVIRAAD